MYKRVPSILLPLIYLQSVKSVRIGTCDAYALGVTCKVEGSFDYCEWQKRDFVAPNKCESPVPGFGRDGVQCFKDTASCSVDFSLADKATVGGDWVLKVKYVKDRTIWGGEDMYMDLKVVHFVARVQARASFLPLAGSDLIVNHTDCYELNLDYKGDDIIKYYSPSPENCQTLCQRDESCHYWTWSTGDRQRNPFHCFLKSNNSQPVFGIDLVSGPRECDASGNGTSGGDHAISAAGMSAIIGGSAVGIALFIMVALVVLNQNRKREYDEEIGLRKRSKLFHREKKSASVRVKDCKRGRKKIQPVKGEYDRLCTEDRAKNVNCKTRKMGQKSVKLNRRGKGVVPYDHSRVVLKETIEDSDYINANWVTVGAVDLESLSKSNSKFKSSSKRKSNPNLLNPTSIAPILGIATQTPLTTTRQHFWAMIVENKVNLIVALMDEHSLDEDRYWPQGLTCKTEGEFKIENGAVSATRTASPHYELSKLIVKKQAEANAFEPETEVEVNYSESEVWHILFTKAFKASNLESTANLISTIIKYQTKTITDTTLVVHCSDGAHKSGVILSLLDLALKVEGQTQLGLDSAAAVSVYDSVLSLRRSRPGMVRGVNCKQEHYLFKMIAFAGIE